MWHDVLELNFPPDHLAFQCRDFFIYEDETGTHDAWTREPVKCDGKIWVNMNIYNDCPVHASNKITKRNNGEK